MANKLYHKFLLCEDCRKPYGHVDVLTRPQAADMVAGKCIDCNLVSLKKKYDRCMPTAGAKALAATGQPMTYSIMSEVDPNGFIHITIFDSYGNVVGHEHMQYEQYHRDN